MKRALLAALLVALLATASSAPAQVAHHVYQLFGPVQWDGAMKQAHGPQWLFPGSALTASTKTFVFQWGYPRARWARLLVIWTPKWSHLRLVHMADGPTDLRQIGSLLSGNGRFSPVVDGFDVTAEFNQLVQAGQDRHIGYQTWDQGPGSQPDIYEVRLEVFYEAQR